MMRHFGLDQCKQIKVYCTEEISIRLQYTELNPIMRCSPIALV